MIAVKLACYCGYIDKNARWGEKQFSEDPMPNCPTGCGRILSPLGGINRRRAWQLHLGEWCRRQKFRFIRLLFAAAPASAREPRT